MNVIAEFHVEGPGLLLSTALVAVPGIQAELEQHTANERGMPILFLWADGGNFDGFERALATDETVASVAVIDEQDDRRLYRVECAVACFYQSYRETASKFFALVGTQEGWDIRMRFPGREEFLAFRRYFADQGASFRLDRLYRESEREIEESAMTPVWERDLGLTAAQYETLLVAFEWGYYDEPRATGLEELAEEFSISPQAVAGRLRRAHRNLIEGTLLADADGTGSLGTTGPPTPDIDIE